MPLVKSASKKAISFNIKEMMKAGHPQNQSIAAALSTARKYARKGVGGGQLETTGLAQVVDDNPPQDPRMRSIGIRPIEGTPDAPEQPVQSPPQGSWGPPVASQQPSEDDLTKAYLKNLTGTETPASPGKIASGLAEGLAGWVKGPGQAMEGPTQVEHETPGLETEEEAYKQQLANEAYQKETTDWAAGTALGQLGMARMPGMVPEGAIGAGGGNPSKPTFTHPQPNGHGEPVQIKNPDQPSSTSSWFNPSGVATFVPGQKMLEGDTLNKIPFKPWAPPEGGWVEHFSNYDDPIHETPFVDHPTKQAASGVVILEPDGRMWLTAPTNQFGGYKSTFPKGKLDPGLTMQENAIKEAYEETGLKVRLMSQLADVDKTTSRTRYYLATRESGTPAAMGWESQAAHLVPWSKAKEFLNSPLDHQVLDALTKKAAELKKGPAPESPQPTAPGLPPAKSGPDANGKYFGKYFHPYDLDPEEVKGAKLYKSNYETGGSNPGGVYHLKDGTPVYIKQVHGENALERTYNEKLANELLKLADVPVADVRMTQFNGHPAIASYMVPAGELNSISPTKYATLKGLREHYPAHLWTGNYDFVGTGKNNIMVMPDGQTVHIDPGGALRYRAQGKLKGPDMWGPNVEHFKMTPGKDLTDVMGEHYNNKQMMAPSAQRVANITDQQIHDLVQQYGPLQKGEKAKLEETLKARRDGVAKMYGVDKGGSTAPPTTGGTKHAPKPVPLGEAKATANKIFQDANGNVKKMADAISGMKDSAVAKYIAGKLPDSVKKKVIDKVNEKELTEHIFGTPAEQAQLHSDKASAKFLLKTHGDDIGGIAQEIWDIAHEVGPKAADSIVKHLPEEMYTELDQHLDGISEQHGKNPWEPTKSHGQEDAMWGDNPDHPAEEPYVPHTSEDLEKSREDFKHHRNEWFHNLINVPHSGILPNGYQGLEFQTPGQLAELLHKFDKFHELGVIRDIDLQKYKPPTISNAELKKIQPTKASFEHAISNGFAPWLTLFRGSHNIPSGHYPELFRDPLKKKGTYKDERSIDFSDQYNVAGSYGGMYPSGPVMARGAKVLEFYWPNLQGKLYDKNAAGSSYHGPLKEAIIEAAHKRGYDLIIAHGMNDLGGTNQTQYMFLNTAGTLRAFSAKLDPKYLHPAKGWTEKDIEMARNPLLGLAGGTAFVYGAMRGKGEDEKMARGGKVKFKPFSSVENLTGLDEGYRHKPYYTPKKPKKLARGGATEPEPQDHEFINFKRGGMIESNIPGRTDKIPMKVATGAYVLPADIPSALGQGNTIAGKSILDKMFNSGPYGLPLAKGKSSKFQMPHLKGFAQGGRAAAEQVLPPSHELGMKVPKGGSMCANCSFFEGDDKCGNDGFAKWHGSHQLPQPANEYCCDLYAHHQKMADGGGTDHTPIIAAGGEYILNPDEVRHVGNGDIGKGHRVLDSFVLHTRREHIKTLRKLKPPK